MILYVFRVKNIKKYSKVYSTQGPKLFYQYLGRNRKYASMRLGPVGTEGLLGSSRSEDPTKTLPKPSEKL